MRVLSTETKFGCQIACTVDTTLLQLEEFGSLYSETFEFTAICTIRPLYFASENISL